MDRTEPLPRWLQGVGILFLAWWAFDFILKSATLGFTRYNWLWFCSVSLVLLGIGLAFARPAPLNAFLGMAMVFQSHWIIDFAIGAFAAGQAYPSFVSTYVFKPGFPWYEFANTMRHLFMLPFAFLGCLLLRQPSRWALPLGIAFGAALLGLSFIATDPADNVNCVFASCVPLFDFVDRTPFYGAVYTVIAVLVGAGGVWFVNSGTARLRGLRGEEWRRARRDGWRVFAALLAIAGVLLLQGLRIYLKVQLGA